MPDYCTRDGLKIFTHGEFFYEAIDESNAEESVRTLNFRHERVENNDHQPECNMVVFPAGGPVEDRVKRFCTCVAPQAGRVLPVAEEPIPYVVTPAGMALVNGRREDAPIPFQVTAAGFALVGAR